MYTYTIINGNNTYTFKYITHNNLIYVLPECIVDYIMKKQMKVGDIVDEIHMVMKEIHVYGNHNEEAL